MLFVGRGNARQDLGPILFLPLSTRLAVNSQLLFLYQIPGQNWFSRTVKFLWTLSSLSVFNKSKFLLSAEKL